MGERGKEKKERKREGGGDEGLTDACNSRSENLTSTCTCMSLLSTVCVDSVRVGLFNWSSITESLCC